MKTSSISSLESAVITTSEGSANPAAATREFTDRPDGVTFKYHHELPRKMVRDVNISALQLYALYRNSIYESYKDLPDLAEDIKAFPKQYNEIKRSSFTQTTVHDDPLYHYAVAAAANTLKEWKSNPENTRAYIAYKNEHDADTGASRERKIGFINFVNTALSGKPVVYIGQAGVRDFDKSIGRRLTESVIAGYPAGTEFYVLTRVFNARTKNLVKKFEQKGIDVSEIKKEEIMNLNYDPERYCGFKYVLSQEMIDDVKSRQHQQSPQAAPAAGTAS